MNRSEFDAHITRIIRIYWRSLLENDGAPPPKMLDMFAYITGTHAIQAVRQEERKKTASEPR